MRPEGLRRVEAHEFLNESNGNALLRYLRSVTIIVTVTRSEEIVTITFLGTLDVTRYQ